MKMKTFTQTELHFVYSSRWCRADLLQTGFSSRKQFMQIIIYWIPYHPYHLSLFPFFFMKYVHEHRTVSTKKILCTLFCNSVNIYKHSK